MSGNGFILKTTNGGNTWVEGTPFPERFEDIKFVSKAQTFNFGPAQT